MRRLVHVCCANCLADVAGEMAQDSTATLYFANQNIHPLIEWRKRLKSVRLLAARLGLELIEGPYGLKQFLEDAGRAQSAGDRCGRCYAMRMGDAARKAKELGADEFTTTLLVSRLQDGAKVREAGAAAARETGVRFFAPEVAHLFGSGAARPKDLHLYRQSYCGCVFSEEERFRETSKGF